LWEDGERVFRRAWEATFGAARPHERRNAGLTSFHSANTTYPTGGVPEKLVGDDASHCGKYFRYVVWNASVCLNCFSARENASTKAGETRALLKQM
jgi:hypothetical protein